MTKTFENEAQGIVKADFHRSWFFRRLRFHLNTAPILFIYAGNYLLIYFV